MLADLSWAFLLLFRGKKIPLEVVMLFLVLFDLNMCLFFSPHAPFSVKNALPKSNI
jgi:hypothetical protein